VADRAAITIWRGKKNVVVFQFILADGVTPDPTIDTTVNQYRAMIRARSTDLLPAATFTCTTPQAHEIILTLAANDCDDLELRPHVFDIEETVPGGDPQIIVDGDVEVREAVTR
jgi:hypothetical protein